MTMRLISSRRARGSISRSARARSPRTLQHRQPAFSSTILSSSVRTSRWSRPISPNSLTSTAARASAGCRSRWLSRVVLPAPRKPVTTVTGVVSAMRMAVECLGRNLGCHGLDQPAIAGSTVEAGPPPGMAGDAVLMHAQQHGVAVAIDQKLPQVLGLAGGLALAPQPVAAAAEVADPAGGQGFAHRLGIHPGHHQHLAGTVLLGDGGNEAVGIEVDGGQHSLCLRISLVHG